MKNSTTLIALFLLIVSCPLMAQESSPVSADSLALQVNSLKKDLGFLKRIKISGYLQPQFQFADSSGEPSFAGGNFAAGVDKRFMIRRGRVKFQYTSPTNAKGIATSQYVLQLDATERGIAVKDVYVRITEPWTGYFSLTAGMFNNPFGHEITYSSSQRESPERGRMSQLHFPNEREVGVMLTIQPPKNSKWNWLRLDAGFFNGIGAPSVGIDVSDFDNKKDFISRLSLSRTTRSEKINYGAGVSYYDGGFRIDSVTVYEHGKDANGTSGFIIDSRAIDNGPVPIGSRDYTRRNYIGADAQFAIDWKAGTTALRGEFIAGEQPGNSSSAKSPNDKNPITKDIYSRNFNGAYFYFIQDVFTLPFQVVIKYDWYDPNTDVSGNEIGQSMIGAAKATNETDLRYDTWGFGLLYHFDANIRFMAYYDLVKNETSNNLPGFAKDRNDNVFTIRMQVKF